MIASVKSLISFFFHIIMLNELDDRNACKDKLSILSGESSSGNIFLEFEHTRFLIFLSFETCKGWNRPRPRGVAFTGHYANFLEVFSFFR